MDNHLMSDFIKTRDVRIEDTISIKQQHSYNTITSQNTLLCIQYVLLIIHFNLEISHQWFFDIY